MLVPRNCAWAVLLLGVMMAAASPGAYADVEARIKNMRPPKRTVFNLVSFERLNSPEEGGAVLALGPEGSYDSAWICLPEVHFDGHLYRMWYSASPVPPYYTGQPSYIMLATSTDGIHWQRANNGEPVLRPGEPGAFDEAQVMGGWVLHEAGIWKMWYCGLRKPATEPPGENWPGVIPEGWEPRLRIGLATSRDGIHWERQNDGRPVLDLGPMGSTGDLQVMHPTVIREADGYRMWYASNSIGIPHTISMATSSDGIHWEKARDGRPVEGIGWYSTGPAVYAMGNEYLMLYSPEDLEENVWIVRAAVSHDGFHWRVLNEGHNVGPPGEDLQFEGPRVAEEGSTFHPSSLVRQGSSLYFWYGENAGKTYRLAAGRLVFDFPR